MENLASSSTSSQGVVGHDNPSTDLQSPTTPAIHYHICHYFNFLVSSVLRIFNFFRHPPEIDDSNPVGRSMEETPSSPPEIDDSNPVDRSMEETSGCPSFPIPREDNQTATASSKPYQVFINHRGADVKQTLASTVYYYLQSKGLQVFLDNEEFQPGQPLNPAIEAAIRTSSVHIAIFSKRYAESDWCLRELCLMLERRARDGATLIPVFYDVRPSDLRWIEQEKGEYVSAFRKHEEQRRFDLPTISAWKSALKKVSYVSGPDLHDLYTFHGNEGQLLDSLEDAVFQNLKPVPLEVATDPVGLDEAIRDFESCMERERQNENKEVKIVGIVGLGGSGKTTLAKEFFNRQRSSFERSSFLFDVRDASNRKTLPNLQSKLLQDLLRVKECKIDSVSEGKGIIRDRLQSLTPRVLVALDDIDHQSQVEALLVKDVLRSDSLIIVISRDEDALKFSGAAPIYKIKKLDPKDAQRLFCKHSFLQPCPIVGFEELTKKFCERCGGLPLFLKVMGAHLRVKAAKNRTRWEDELDQIPNDILQILNVSYNSLNEKEKQIFLDIACFFSGEKKNLAIKVWDTCEGRGLSHLENLENKCLVEFDDEKCFKMHDHLRDFGREIADKESPCRLWDKSQEEQQKATEKIRGIIAATPDRWNIKYNERRRLCESTYEAPLKKIELSALKILAIHGDCFDEQTGGRSKNLVWLRWFQCPHTNISPWLISMKYLTVLEIFGGELETWPLCDELVNLRELRIVGTHLSMISISENVCPRLEHLVLLHNYELIEVKHLQHLASSQKLYARDCESLRLLEGLEHLQQLRVLDISRCSELCELRVVQHLALLEELYASDCQSLRLLEGLEHLQQLRVLDISGCSELQQLRELGVSRCAELTELPGLQQLASLESLQASGCTNLHHLEGLEHLEHLRDLDISRCSELPQLPGLQHLASLKKLNASRCANLRHLEGLEYLSQLQCLDISCCSELHELPTLQHLAVLQHLDVSDCAILRHLEGLDHLQQLRDLGIPSCIEMREPARL